MILEEEKSLIAEDFTHTTFKNSRFNIFLDRAWLCIYFFQALLYIGNYIPW